MTAQDPHAAQDHDVQGGHTASVVPRKGDGSRGSSPDPLAARRFQKKPARLPRINRRGGPHVICNHAPMPDSGAYGHWRCQRRRFHLGRHRFNNYTWRRGAKLRSDLRYALLVARHHIRQEPPWKRPHSRTRTQYDPVRVLGLNENGGFSRRAR